MAIRRRDILIITSIWLTGCLVVLVLLGFYFSTGSSATPEPLPVATFVIPPGKQTAKQAYWKVGLPQAQDWHSDVALVSISTRWPDVTVEQLGQAPVWDMRFYSPRYERLYFGLVTPDEQGMGRAHLVRLRYPPPLIDPAAWVIDSDEAILIWANNGGGAFIRNYPGSRVEALLRQSAKRSIPMWDIVGINGDQSQVFYLAIDATNGSILDK